MHAKMSTSRKVIKALRAQDCWPIDKGEYMKPATVPGYIEYTKAARPKVPNYHFVSILARNVNNERLTDHDFRQFVKNCLEIVEG